MFRKNELLAALARKGMTQQELADSIGINTVTLYRKMNGMSEFSRKEINDICKTLDLDSPMSIFFSPEHTETQE